LELQLCSVLEVTAQPCYGRDGARGHEDGGVSGPGAKAESCAAVVLAAGEARRFGTQKLVMPFGESTVIGSVVAALEGAGVAPVIVVVGPDDGVSAALRGTSAHFVRNPDPARGMLSSLQVGVSALPENVDRFLLSLGDQPRLTAAGLTRLLRAHAKSGKGLARPTYRGKRGHPVVFAGRYRQAILDLTQGQTLRDVIHAHLDDCIEVECASDAFVRDIDTREEYEEEVKRVLEARGQGPGAGESGIGNRGSEGVYREIVRLQQAGRRGALAIPLWFAGSVPLKHHFSLLLRDDGTMLGTIGGGLLEAEVLRQARGVMAGDEPRVMEFDLTQDEAAREGMICGGRCAVLLEPIRPGFAEEVYAAAARAEETGERAAVITVLGERGRGPGARGQGIEGTRYVKLALLTDGILLGTTGDGETDEALRELAAQAVARERPVFVEEPVVTHLEPIVPRPALVIFGAGHVGRVVAHLGALVGFRTVVVDDRAEFANRERFPHANRVLEASVEEAFDVLPIGASDYVVVVTRGHAMDEEVVARALRTPAAYIGLIGSKRKVASVRERLHGRGFGEDDLARLHAPIGLAIGAETVEEIAVSILAEIIAVRRGGEGSFV